MNWLVQIVLHSDLHCSYSTTAYPGFWDFKQWETNSPLSFLLIQDPDLSWQSKHDRYHRNSAERCSRLIISSFLVSKSIPFFLSTTKQRGECCKRFLTVITCNPCFEETITKSIYTLKRKVIIYRRKALIRLNKIVASGSAISARTDSLYGLITFSSRMSLACSSYLLFMFWREEIFRTEDPNWPHCSNTRDHQKQRFQSSARKGDPGYEWDPDNIRAVLIIRFCRRLARTYNVFFSPFSGRLIFPLCFIFLSCFADFNFFKTVVSWSKRSVAAWAEIFFFAASFDRHTRVSITSECRCQNPFHHPRIKEIDSPYLIARNGAA